MAPQCGRAIAGCLAGIIAGAPFAENVQGQNSADESAISFARVDSLNLPASESAQLKHDLELHDYISAEKLLLPEIARDPRSLHAATLLDFTGGIYFLNHDYLNAAVAWNKSDAIVPLQSSVKFSLAMSYIQMGRTDWARRALADLARQNEKDGLYPYWLGRLDFDGHAYSQAAGHFQDAIARSPDMARAYDYLGQCYFHQNQNALAVASYQKAIDLDRNSPHPAAWPYVNLAMVLQLMNQFNEAEANLREAIQIEPDFAQAHFELGNVFEHKGEIDTAIGEFQSAARLDASYAEPHFALARMYRKLGRESAAREEVQTYLRIRAHKGSETTAGR